MCCAFNYGKYQSLKTRVITIRGSNKKKNVAIKGKFQSAGATTLLKSTILKFRTSAESLVHESTLLWLQVQVVFIFRASPIFSDMLTSSWRATFFSKTTFLVKVTTSFCDENLILWRFVEKKERKSDVFRHNELVFQTNKCFRRFFFEQIKKSFWSRTKKMCFLRFNFFSSKAPSCLRLSASLSPTFYQRTFRTGKKLRNATKASKLGIQKIRVEDAIILFRQSQNVPKSKSWIS